MARHPGHIQRRGKTWRVALRVNGDAPTWFGPREYPELATFKRRKDVEEWAFRQADALEKQSARTAAGLPGPQPVSWLFDEYERDQLPRLAETTRKTYGTSLALFRRFFVERHKDPRVDRIRAPHVRKYLRWREEKTGAGARTLAKDRATLHAIFNYAARELELIDSNPVANVRPPKSDNRTPVILDRDGGSAQFDALLTACERDQHGHRLAEAPMLRTYILLLGETGTRCDSEALWLRWEDVDLETGFLRIESGGRKGRRTKSGKTRWVPMTPRLRAAMLEHRLRFAGALYDGKPSEWVFHHMYTRRHGKAGQRIRSFRRGFQAAAKRAKLPADLHVHDLRHRRATSWLAAGKNPVHVKEALGHSDLRTTMHYTHLIPSHLRALVEDGPSRDELKKLGS